MIKKFLSYRGFVCLGSCPSVLVCVPPRRCRAPLRVRARWPRLRGSVAPGLGFVLRRVSCPRCLRSWVLLSSVLGAAAFGLGCCRHPLGARTVLVLVPAPFPRRKKMKKIRHFLSNVLMFFLSLFSESRGYITHYTY